MSVKRQATTELNHENWDQDDPEEHEEMGTFKTAAKDVLEKRVIRTAKRRGPASEEAKKSIFGAFGGFNKTQPSSFDFLSKLTNGSKSNESSKTDTSTSSLFAPKPESTSSLFASKPESTSSLFTSKADSSPSLFSNKPDSSSNLFSSKASPSSGSSIFTAPTSTTQTFGVASTTNSLFGGSNTKTSPTFNSKSDSPVTNSQSENKSSSTTIPAAPVSFGIPSTTSNKTSTNSNSTPFKIQPTTNSTSNFGIGTKTDSNSKEQKNLADDDKKIKYYSKLKGLNESVSSWIKEHVEKTPLCILSPIFKDYEKYLKEIQEEFHGTGTETEKSNYLNVTPVAKPAEQSIAPKPVSTTDSNKGSSLFTPPNSKSPFATQNNTSTEKPATFSFGIKTTPPSSNAPVAPATPPGFSFGATSSNAATSNAATTTASFSFGTSTTTVTTNGSPFSFGTGKPFSFSPNVANAQATAEKTEETNEDDEPPKVEFTPVVEENSVFDKKCKVFVKKDGNFVDKGVGTLYLKKIEESGKHQLLVRANTNLGTILVNLILVSGIPTQRMGKNNVMLVCIPTPDAKPPPTPILIRVKTSEEADELLATLNKYKA